MPERLLSRLPLHARSRSTVRAGNVRRPAGVVLDGRQQFRDGLRCEQLTRDAPRTWRPFLCADSRSVQDCCPSNRRIELLISTQRRPCRILNVSEAYVVRPHTIGFAAACAASVCLSSCSSSPDGLPGCAETFLSATFELPDGTTREFCIPGAVMKANFDSPSGCRLLGSSLGVEDARANLVVSADGDWFGRAGVHSPVSFLLQSAEVTCDAPERGCTFANHMQCQFDVVRPALADGQLVEARLEGSCPLNGDAGFGTTNFPTLVAASFRARLTSTMTEEGTFQCFYPYDSGIGPP